MARAWSRIGLLILFSVFDALAQETPVKIYGYSQTSFQHWTEFDGETTHPELKTPETLSARNTFSAQQLNLFLSRNLTHNWRAFFDFEFLNSYSSRRQWGEFNLEEAWIRYKSSDAFSLKLGLQIPVFNNLNEIKNRTPLLPYIIRPVFYETSFSQLFSDFDEFTPNRAFVSVAGTVPAAETKIDYAVYLGNSPNISRAGDEGLTGIDTTSSLLVGGRVGIRREGAKAGLSATYEKVNLQKEEQIIDDRLLFLIDYDSVPRIRLGGDLSFPVGRFFFEGEFIGIGYDDDDPRISINKKLFYGTIGYRYTEQTLAYVSYWSLGADFPVLLSASPFVTSGGRETIDGRTTGVSFDLTDRIALKAQWVHVALKQDIRLTGAERLIEERTFDILALAASVFF